MEMVYVTMEDFRAVVTDRDRGVLAPEGEMLATAEGYALGEVRAYIGGRYDLDVEFDRVGDRRNGQLVMTVVDIMLYHLSATLPQRMSFEQREQRYARAVAFLKDVQAGRASPVLPPLLDSDGVDSGGDVLYGGWKKSGYEY